MSTSVETLVKPAFRGPSYKASNQGLNARKIHLPYTPLVVTYAKESVL